MGALEFEMGRREKRFFFFQIRLQTKSEAECIARSLTGCSAQLHLSFQWLELSIRQLLANDVPPFLSFGPINLFPFPLENPNSVLFVCLLFFFCFQIHRSKSCIKCAIGRLHCSVSSRVLLGRVWLLRKRRKITKSWV